MNSDNLKGVLQQFVSRPLPRCRGRELELPLGTGKVIGLAGVRRSRKTFLFSTRSNAFWRREWHARSSFT